MSGALVFADTRVPVDALIDYLKAGETLERFLEGFPTMKRKQAEAFLRMRRCISVLSIYTVA